jgi:hypothetical protein
MDPTVIIIACLFGITVMATIVICIVSRKAFEATLASFVTVLASLAAATVTPSIQGQVDIALDFGALGHVTGNYLKVNAPQPTGIWYIAFVGLGLLTAMTLWFIRDRDRHVGATATGGHP